MVSPLRYPGGKTRACKTLDAILSEYFVISNFDTLLSPFFGGGSFELYQQNKNGMSLIVNDKFTPLYNFWNQTKTNKVMLCDELRKIPEVSKEQFATYRNTIMTDDAFQQALKYFIINRCSFSGSTLSGGFSKESSLKRYTQSSINRISALNLTNVEIYNLDFTEFINNNANERTLMFVDPPYYLEKNSRLYGKNGDMHEDFNHQGLYDLLKTKSNWLLTYNDCHQIRELYRDYIILDAEWSYSMNKTKKSSEIVIVSNTVD